MQRESSIFCLGEKSASFTLVSHITHIYIYGPIVIKVRLNDKRGPLWEIPSLSEFFKSFVTKKNLYKFDIQ